MNSISWGTNHCVFVDNMGRVFSFGENKEGKTGQAQKAMNEDRLKKEEALMQDDGELDPIGIKLKYDKLKKLAMYVDEDGCTEVPTMINPFVRIGESIVDV